MIGYVLAGSTFRSSRSQCCHARTSPRSRRPRESRPSADNVRSAVASSGVEERRRRTSRHHHERALEQLGLGRLNDDVIRFVRLVEIHRRLGQLRRAGSAGSCRRAGNRHPSRRRRPPPALRYAMPAKGEVAVPGDVLGALDVVHARRGGRRGAAPRASDGHHDDEHHAGGDGLLQPHSIHSGLPRLPQALWFVVAQCVIA